MTLYKNILFACDLTPASIAAASKAKRLADTMGANFMLVHIIEPIRTYGYPLATDVSEDHINFANEILSQVCGELKMSTEQYQVKTGRVKQGVLDAADDFNADLIITGAHNSVGIERLLGSNATTIINAADVDVLTLHINDDEYNHAIRTFGDGIYVE